MIQIKKQPGKNTIFASCDNAYFSAHAPALISSSVVNDLSIHVHVVNPENSWLEDAALIAYKANRINPDVEFTYSYNNINLDFLPTEDSLKSYYACSRFAYLKEIFSEGLYSVLVVDVDCMVKDHINFDNIEHDIGLFLRQPFPGLEEESTIAAGAVYLDGSGGEIFTNRISELFNNIGIEDYRWFIDQKILYQVYKEFANIIQISNLNDTPDFMDWEFTDTSKIWTGKGNRKHKNIRYLEAKKHYEEKLDEN